MTIVTKIEFSEEEINAMMKTLKCLSDMIDEPSVPSNQLRTASNAFEELSKTLCLNPAGEQAFHHEGW